MGLALSQLSQAFRLCWLTACASCADPAPEPMAYRCRLWAICKKHKLQAHLGAWPMLTPHRSAPLFVLLSRGLRVQALLLLCCRGDTARILACSAVRPASSYGPASSCSEPPCLLGCGMVLLSCLAVSAPLTPCGCRFSRTCLRNPEQPSSRTAMLCPPGRSTSRQLRISMLWKSPTPWALSACRTRHQQHSMSRQLRISMLWISTAPWALSACRTWHQQHSMSRQLRISMLWISTAPWALSACRTWHQQHPPAAHSPALVWPAALQSWLSTSQRHRPRLHLCRLLACTTVLESPCSCLRASSHLIR